MTVQITSIPQGRHLHVGQRFHFPSLGTRISYTVEILQFLRFSEPEHHSTDMVVLSSLPDSLGKGELVVIPESSLLGDLANGFCDLLKESNA